MLRHSCGYYLADQGTDLRTMQDYLGHRDPKHTAYYTRVAGHRFEGLWPARHPFCGRQVGRKTQTQQRNLNANPLHH
jgi:site-specific recombinase XerD